MIATFVVEISAALFILFRYHMNQAIRLIVLALSALAVFQLSEYYVCGGLGANADSWSRLGFVAITALPPIGLHLLYVLSGNASRKLVTSAYATMGVFMAYFLVAPTAFTGSQCTGNYVIFQIGSTAALVYGAYYYGWLLTALLIGWHTVTKTKISKATRQQIGGLLLGYMVFLVPTAIANTVRPETRAGIPSIMCGFAVLFALILTFYIAPRASAIREKAKHPFSR